MTSLTLAKIIDIGTDGILNKGFPPINSMTIMRWIECFLKVKYHTVGTNQSGKFDLIESKEDYLKTKANPHNIIIIDERIYEKY